MDALDGVIDQVPEWHTLLDNLNSQIALRQYKPAELGGDQPPTRSLRPKGSTETLLQQKKTDEHAILEDESTICAPQDPPSVPEHTVHASSNGSLRQLSYGNLSPEPVSQLFNSPHVPLKDNLPTDLHKHKTDSIALGGSQVPKNRKREMVIVYYDSAVQHAFEELVKLIGASRNAMRKGKMAARMADMKKMAETVVVIVPGNNGVQAEKDDSELPKLQFVSTRRIGPSRDSPAAGPGRRMMLPGRQESFPSIFDELDTGLEWCQSMCEHAAHQSLRDGTCDTEIMGIKKRLWEVKEIAEREKVKEKIEREKKDKEEEKEREETWEKPTDQFVRCTRRPDQSRGVKSIQVHKSLIAFKSLEVDKIEIDDEEYDLLPTRQWRSARENVA